MVHGLLPPTRVRVQLVGGERAAVVVGCVDEAVPPVHVQVARPGTVAGDNLMERKS